MSSLQVHYMALSICATGERSFAVVFDTTTLEQHAATSFVKRAIAS